MTSTVTDQPATYTVDDIARLVPCSRRHVCRLAAQDLIPGRIRGLGRLVRFSRAAVDGWLAGLSHSEQTAAGGPRREVAHAAC